MDPVTTRIIACKALEPYKVWVRFVDGIEGVVDLSDLLSKNVFAEAWATEEDFQAVYIDEETLTLTWKLGNDTVDVNRITLKEEILESQTNGDL